MKKLLNSLRLLLLFIKSVIYKNLITILTVIGTVIAFIGLVIAYYTYKNNDIVEELIKQSKEIVNLNKSTRVEISELKGMTFELKKHTDSLAKQNEILRNDNELLQKEVRISSAHFAIIKEQNESSIAFQKNRFFQAIQELNNLSNIKYNSNATNTKANVLPQSFLNILDKEIENTFLEKNRKIYSKWKACRDSLKKYNDLRWNCNGNSAVTISQNCEDKFIKFSYPKILNDFQNLLELLNSNFPNYFQSRKN